MATETLKEFRKMASDQLKAREEELRSELFKLRTGGSTEKVKDTSRTGKIRKDIARILTLAHAQKPRQATKRKTRQANKLASKKAQA